MMYHGKPYDANDSLNIEKVELFKLLQTEDYPFD